MPTPNWFKWRKLFNTSALSLLYVSLQEAEAELANAKEEMNQLTGDPQVDAQKIRNLHKAHTKVETAKSKITNELPQA